MSKILALLNRNEKNKLTLIIFLLVLLGAAEALTFFFLQPISNYFSNNKYNFQIPFLKDFFTFNLNIINLLCIFIFFFVIRFLLTIIVSYKKTSLVRDVNNNLSNKIYSYYIFKEFQFYINNSNSKFLTNIIEEVEKFSYRVIDCFIGLITEIFLVTGVLVFLFIMYFYVSLSLFVLAVLFFTITYNLYKYKFKNLGEIKVKNDADKIEILYKSFYIIQNIKLDNLENFFINNFKKKTETSSRSHFLLSFLNELPKPILEIFLLFFVLALVFFLYSYLSITKEGILAILVIYGIAMFRILPSLSRIVGYLNQIKYFYPTTEIIKNILKDKNLLENTKSPQKEYLGLKRNIKIENLSFKYDRSDHYTLNNINLEIIKNEITGISGHSGSGKSTLLNLLSYLLKPTSGRILIDDEPLENIYKSFQPKIGYVPQKIYLANGSIIENVILGKSIDSYDYKLFKEVIDICGLTTLIDSLADKEQSWIGERGAKLSGGQQQRLGIARALYKKPDILILDEATNALDSDSEEEILKIILNLVTKTTIILVSHKDSVLQISKRIYEIKNTQINQAIKIK
jgi:ABC-type bacteriocin/lantibiotic exporter with double-glycine peptidase domain